MSTASVSSTSRQRRSAGIRWARAILAVLAVYVLVVLALMWWWDHEPAHLDIGAQLQRHSAGDRLPVVAGTATTVALVGSARTLLDKRGGYLSNDHMPPGVWMDNVPNWEFGVLTATRDLTRALRNDFSRSQTQSTEDKDLMEADPLFSSPSNRWLLPSSESQYRKAIRHVERYAGRLADADADDGHFYVRADNLADYLHLVSTRLGSLSQRLSASVGQLRVDSTTAFGLPDADSDAGQQGRSREIVKTPWHKVDDIFYEARGYTWAVRQQLDALRIDFEPVLRDKNAMASMDQVIRELDQSQKSLGSPVVLNGRPFGFFANHSLVMANYVSRANAAAIELRQLLDRG